MSAFDNIPPAIEVIMVTKEDILQLKREMQTLKELKEKYSNVSLLKTCYEQNIVGMERAIEILKI